MRLLFPARGQWNATASDSAAPAPAQPTPGAGPSGHILVIDDEEAIREAVCEVLRRWGCRPVAAENAADGAAAFRSAGRSPDAMVVDYQLADGRSGLEAIALLDAAFGRRVPAIIVTGDTRPERLREASEIGYLLLYKPLAPMRLRAALSAALQPRREEASVA